MEVSHKSGDIRARIRFRDSSDEFSPMASEKAEVLTATFVVVVVGDSARRKIPASFPIFGQIGRQVAAGGHRRCRRRRRCQRRRRRPGGHPGGHR